MRLRGLLLILIVCTLFLSACQAITGRVIGIVTEKPPSEIPPTDIPVPTNIPKPTKTPVPPTPTIPVPDILNQYLEGARIISVDSANKGNGWNLGVAKIKDGYIELIGKDWTGFDYGPRFKEGQGILVNFKFTYGAVFEMYFDNGSFYTDGYKRYGVYLEQAYVHTNRWIGKELISKNFKGNFYTQPDTWYSLLMAVGKDGEFLAVVWDPQDPQQIIQNKHQFEDWKDLSWHLAYGADRGTIQWDQFTVVEFENLK